MLGVGGWNGQRSTENIKRGWAYKVSSIESQIKVKIGVAANLLFVYQKKFQYFYSLLFLLSDITPKKSSITRSKEIFLDHYYS
jgi:hypothetical protein